MLLVPWPPVPMQAMVTRSLGAAWALRPSTLALTISGVAAAALRNWRRVDFFRVVCLFNGVDSLA